MLRIEDEVAALDFDLACTLRLKLYDDEREKRLIEALTTGVGTAALSGLASGLTKVPHRKR